MIGASNRSRIGPFVFETFEDHDLRGYLENVSADPGWPSRRWHAAHFTEFFRKWSAGPLPAPDSDLRAIITPYLTLRILQNLLQNEGYQFPQASEVLFRLTYVNDIITGMDHIN